MPALVFCASRGARYQTQELLHSDNASETQKYFSTFVDSDTS